MDTITKQDLIDRISFDTDVSKREVRKVLRSILEEITVELSRGNRLEFRDFGIFEIADRAPRKARNPITGMTLDVPARQVVRFRASTLMRKRAERRFEPGSASTA